jgi:hypothetical protein
MLAIGERDEAGDYMVHAAKVRTPSNELFERL